MTDSTTQVDTNRDLSIKEHILEQDGANPDQYIEIVKKPWDDTSKFRIGMVVAPSWAKFFPPYGVAKLTGIMRSHGYAVRVYDANVETFHFLKKQKEQKLWDPTKTWMWRDHNAFQNEILPKISNLLDDVIFDIIKSKVRVVGFSVFVTNEHVTKYMISRIRELDPNICVVIGGPSATWLVEWGTENKTINYAFIGEAEEQLMYVLENLPDVLPIGEVVGDSSSRLSLEKYPYADYSDYNIKLYDVRGISVESSRGCIAKCSFCEETHYWKYRDVEVEHFVNEIEHQVTTLGVKRIWLVDSLANGNLKKLDAWMSLLIERNLEISWNGYCRCDGRMDLEFFKKMKASGCTNISFGIESGSQKVLDDMHKKIKVEEVIQNMRDCHNAGIKIHSNWLQGFPTENALDQLHTRQLVFNCRKWLDIAGFGSGSGAVITQGSDLANNLKLYGISCKEEHELTPDDKYFDSKQHKFLGDWYTVGYTNTLLHRFLRIKLMYIWWHIMKYNCPDTLVKFDKVYPDLAKFYTFEFDKHKNLDQVEQRNYLDLYHDITNDFAGSIAAEYLGFMYNLYQVYGSFTWSFMCDPELDVKNFNLFSARNYTCNVVAKVEDDGSYEFTISHELVHSDFVEECKKQDMSFKQSYTVNGNMNEWVSNSLQVGESVHPQYRKKIIPISQF